MSDQSANPEGRRGPRVFRTDDPNLVEVASQPDPLRDRPSQDLGSTADDAAETGIPEPSLRARAGIVMQTGFRWGMLLVTTLAGMAAVSLGLWFWRLVSVGLERDDWIGIAMKALAAVAAIAILALLMRELLGWRRLTRLTHIRRDVEAAIAARNARAERQAADMVIALYSRRPDLAWAIDRVKTHSADVLDAGAYMTLVERELIANLDISARRLITTSAKRVSTVTALSPMASIAFTYIVVENVGLLRRLATLYGGRPGLTGGFALARTVIGNLIAAGGMALTDDLLGQFIGQDLLRRLSRRLGEGAFNGALTARIGVAGIAAVRPLPFLEAQPVRARAILGEVLQSLRGA